MPFSVDHGHGLFKKFGYFICCLKQPSFFVNHERNTTIPSYFAGWSIGIPWYTYHRLWQSSTNKLGAYSTCKYPTWHDQSTISINFHCWCFSYCRSRSQNWFPSASCKPVAKGSYAASWEMTFGYLSYDMMAIIMLITSILCIYICIYIYIILCSTWMSLECMMTL